MEQNHMRIGHILSTKCLSKLLLLVGVIMMILGLLAGEQNAVLEKATQICLECIGIG